ncbi:FAS1 domain-containing protein [Mytilinidion resinicola]|uniref:FAS1 domain-containing protein n=1 Tax=Mytilinidion resinicola TaxID=574789 RepID=A0A6A6YN85_9PEZI|nr:FAS1 domain-containing protein [Mytilinidion resinicola]KAF2810019.1 FAS1 domain-containing protein [Mytilinidion resinicola]
MKLLHLLPLATLGASLVIVDEKVFQEIEVESHQVKDPVAKLARPCHDKLLEWKGEAESIIKTSKNYLDEALARVIDVSETSYDKIYSTGYDVQAWLEGSPFAEEFDDDESDHPHHPPPHHGPPHHRKPHHPPHHHKPNLTVYELIAKSKYTTKLAKIISEDAELVQVLNGTKANYTIFAPTDKAFEKIPHHGKEPSKEFIKDLLLYHVSPEFYPAGRVLHSYTIPTLYEPSTLGHPQRLVVSTGLGGIKINFYSKIVAVNIFGTNGVIHGVDSIIIPPPKVVDIIGFFPGEFSTLTLGLTKTGLLEALNDTSKHTGGIFFAPGNFAFKKLGPKINAFLFSKFGTPYLKALLEYHVVVNQTLYSDAFFDATADSVEVESPRYAHYDFPTGLKDKSLAVDVTRFGPFVTIKINRFSKVAIANGVAKDGVIHIVSNVLIPPKKTSGSAEPSFWNGEELTVEEFKDRLEPFVKDETPEL